MSTILPSHFFKNIIALFVLIFGWLNQQVDILSTPVLRDIFLALYFTYKRHLEDPFHGLITARPELFQNGHIFDIGSNVGFTVSLFASVASAGYQVHAFEPEPKNFALLKRVVRKKKISLKVCLNRFAVGNNTGDVQLRINRRHHGDHRVHNATTQPLNIFNSLISVPSTTIDDYWKSLPEPRKVAFVKIDVQGFEPAVIQGMQALLKAQEDVIVALEFVPEDSRSLGFSSELVFSVLNSWKGRIVYTLNKGGQLHRMDNLNSSNYPESLNLLIAPETLLI